MDNLLQYVPGDIVVHRYYGIGKIDGIEIRPFNGIEVECYKVKTRDSTYWFPTDSANNPRVRPMVSQEIIQKAIEILRSEPHGLEIDLLQWKERIDEVQSNGDFLDISSLIRDLAALKTRKKKLSQIQDHALNNLEDRLIGEWAASLGSETKAIRPMLLACLRESTANLQNAG